MLIIARQQIDPRNVIARNHALDFIQNRHGVERRHFRFEVMRFEPHRVTIRLARLRPAGLAHVGVRPAPEGHQTAHVGTHGGCDANDHFEVGPGVCNFARLLHQLQIAAGVRIRSRFLVRVCRGQNHVGKGGGFGQEHILNHHKRFRENKGINAQAAHGIGTHDVKRLEFSGLRRFHHLRKAQAFFRRQLAPFLWEFSRAGDGLVSRQKIGIKPHFAGPARIRVIAEADQLRSRQGRSKTYQLFNVMSAQFGAEGDDQVLLGADFVAQGDPGVAVCTVAGLGVDQRIEQGIIAAEEGDRFRFSAGWKQAESRSLPPQLDGRRVDDVKLRAPQPYVRPYLPRQKRMLIRGVVADQQNRGRGQHVAHGGRLSRLAVQRRRESREVGGPMMIDVIGLEHGPRKF